MKIKINNTTWNVYLVREFKDNSDTLGRTYFVAGVIEISANLSPEKLKTTIIHELVHAYLSSYGIIVPNIDSVMLFSEEQVCEFIAMNGEQIMALADKVYNNLSLRV